MYDQSEEFKKQSTSIKGRIDLNANLRRRNSLIRKVGRRCAKCKIEFGTEYSDLTLDHVIPKEIDPYSREYQLLCKPCHNLKNLFRNFCRAKFGSKKYWLLISTS
ncbi:MAG: HNH endonuclease signature motif containing protein [Nitrososphaeraceae archaeon]